MEPGASMAGHPAGYRVAEQADQAQFGPDLARSAWPALLAAGLGVLVLGIILLAWPKATLLVVAVLIGASLVLAGLERLIHGFTAHDASGGRRVGSVVVGLLAIVVGLYLIRHYHITVAAIAIVVGLFWVIHGLADITLGLFGGPASGRAIAMLVGILSLAAGLIVLFWPAISLTILIAVIGIWLIVYGVFMMIMAFRFRREGSRGAGPGGLAAA
jgi:uncharacterized membrane protein HdeD (DUF308 family)